MIEQLFTGAGYVLRGFKLIREPGLRRFVAIPFLLNLVIFSVAIYGGIGLLETYLVASLPGWLSWLQWLILPLFGLTILIAVFYTFTLIANLLGSPFNSVLAEKVERKLRGEAINQNSSLLAIAGDAVKSLASEVRKLIYLALWIIPLLLLFVIPGLNLAAPFAWGLFSAWMLALEYGDYPMGNHSIRFSQQRKLFKANKGLAWGFGGGILLMTMIPVLNFFAMPVGVAGATALWLEQLNNPRL